MSAKRLGVGPRARALAGIASALRSLDCGPVVTSMRQAASNGMDPYNSADAAGREWNRARRRSGWVNRDPYPFHRDY